MVEKYFFLGNLLSFSYVYWGVQTPNEPWLPVELQTLKSNHYIPVIIALCLMLCHGRFFAQIEENPLKGMTWATAGIGANSADHASWYSAVTLAKRGDVMTTQGRLAFSQELAGNPKDTCTFKKNRLAELGLMWGDGWGGRKWYVHGSIGFGLNVRSYCDDGLYSPRYLTAVTIGVPAQVEFGAFITKNWGITMAGSGNWNFRAPYAGGWLGVVYRP